MAKAKSKRTWKVWALVAYHGLLLDVEEDKDNLLTDLEWPYPVSVEEATLTLSPPRKGKRAAK